MTTMDSDSESQDSDDGRRFRFEATRKDSTVPLESGSNDKSLQRKTKHTSYSQAKVHHDKKERSKYESNKESRYSKERDNSDKDSRHITKQSRSLRHEDDKITHKEQKDLNFTSNEKGLKNSANFESRDKARNSKYYRDRDRIRSSHYRQRSQERSHDRNHEERSLVHKHRSKCREKFKHHSRHKSRDRSSNKLRSSDSDRSREEHTKHDSCKKISKIENKMEHLKESYHTNKNIERNCSESESHLTSFNEARITLPNDSQDCKDIDLSDYDVLSETDENLSDVSDSRSYTSTSHCCKSKVIKQNLQEECEDLTQIQMSENQQHLEELHKVNQRSSSRLPGSSNNNPSAISDSLLGSTSSTCLRIAEHMNREKESTEHPNTEDTFIFNCKTENSNSAHENLQNGSDGCFIENIELSRQDTKLHVQQTIKETDNYTYGPALPPQLVPHSALHFNSSDNRKIPENVQCSGNHGDTENKNTAFIGPCLPQKLTSSTDTLANIQKDGDNYKLDYNTDDQDSRQKSSKVDQYGNFCNLVKHNTDMDVSFGPALPPHLLQQRNETETPNTIIGPTKPLNEDSEIRSTVSEDESLIGPLPMDHPALRDNYVHEQLNERAKKIKENFQEKTDCISNQREEWMIELPPAKAANLGLAPRKFRLTVGPDMSDRSCWTDTPAKKAQKQKKQEEDKMTIKSSAKIKKKNCYVEDSANSRKQEKSLLEIHQSSLQKKRKAEETNEKLIEKSRRPFSRDIDLQTNQLDQSQKKTVFMKAQLLNDRFTRGEI